MHGELSARGAVESLFSESVLYERLSQLDVSVFFEPSYFKGDL